MSYFNGPIELSTNDSLKNIDIIDQLPVAVYVCDLNGNITSYNEKASALWGRKPDLGSRAELFCGASGITKPDGSIIPHHQTPMEACLPDGKPLENEVWIIERSDLTRITISLSVVPMKDDEGHVTGLIHCFYEISERKNFQGNQPIASYDDHTPVSNSTNDLTTSENTFRRLRTSLEKTVEEKTADLVRINEEIRKSEERYHKMIEEVEDYAIILLDKQGIIQNWNKGAEKIKGYKEGEIVGKSFILFYSKKDQEAGLPLSLLDHAKKQGKAIHEGWRMRKDGSAFWGSIVLTALHDDGDNVIGFSKVTRDLTERKLAEDKLKEYNLELEFQNNELEQFAYAASHDMKEPLRKIHFYNHYISQTAADKLDNKSREYLSRSLHAVNRMSKLIDDLLTYSRTTSNAESFEETDLNQIATEIAQHHKEDAEQKKISIIVGSLPVIKAVPFQIKQLLENLVTNAIKYKHPAREVLIKINSETVKGEEIKEKNRETAHLYHKISVTDNGIGFEPQYAQKIFEIFQRLNNHSTTGSGIGLAICNRIVQNHRGFIKASGQMNEGARFDIYIPAEH